MVRYQHNRLQQLRGFYYAARTKSFSKAAEQMELSQPSISLQIQALERDLGTKLFQRRGRIIRLTREGEMMLELARPLIEGFDALEEDFAARRDSIARGSVRIAAGGSTLQYVLPPFIEGFVQQYPHIDLRLYNVRGEAGLALLRAGEVDLAVGPMPDAPPDITFRSVVSYDPVLITSQDHPLAARRRVTLKHISQYPLILPPRDQSTWRSVEMVFAEHSVRYEVKLEVGGYDVIKTYVQLGLGISIVLEHCLTGDEQLHTASMKRYFPSRSYGLVLLKGRPLTPATRQFVQTICPD